VGPPLPEPTLDAILVVQLTVAWAGEGRCSPRRLGWWETDLIDEAGGGDFLERLLPRTHAWASLEAAREAARRIDAGARASMADPEGARTLYFLGFEVDEQLDLRLAAHKRAGRPPAEALDLPFPLGADFSAGELSSWLLFSAVPFEQIDHCRRLSGEVPGAVDVLVKRLGAALLPFAERYAAPFYALPG
jgi:hypothetical protein